MYRESPTYYGTYIQYILWHIYTISVYTHKPDLSILGEAGLHLVDI